jgi:hypothetical protein
MIGAPEVHVLMPAYNAAAFIEPSMRSVLSQLYPTKLIVYNDGSTDDTAEIVQRVAHEMPGRVELVSGPNRGQPFVRASLVETSRKLDPTAPFMWLDSDDTFVDVHSVETVMDKMHKTKSQICLFSYQTRWADDSETARRNASNFERSKTIRDKLLYDIEHSPSGVVSIQTFPDLLGVAVTVWTKAFAPSLKSEWPRSAPPIFCEDIPSMSLLLKVDRVSALNRPIVSYLRRAESTTGKQRPSNYLLDLPAQYDCFLDGVDVGDAYKADAARKFVANRIAIHERSLGVQIDTQRPGFTPATLDDYRTRSQLLQQRF